MFRLEFGVPSADGGIGSRVVFCQSFTTDWDKYSPGGYIATKHANGRKEFYLALTNVRVETL